MLVVIDALRADFVFADSTLVKMGVKVLDGNDKKKRERPKITVLTDWIQNSNPSVKAFVAKVHSPTVTMPRIKVRTMWKLNNFFSTQILREIVYIFKGHDERYHPRICRFHFEFRI